MGSGTAGNVAVVAAVNVPIGPLFTPSARALTLYGVFGINPSIVREILPAPEIPEELELVSNDPVVIVRPVPKGF